VLKYQCDQFEHWKRFYKTSVGALHIWSWRTTPIIGCFFALMMLAMVNGIITIIFLYMTIHSMAGMSEYDKSTAFHQIGNQPMQRIVMVTIFLLGLTVGVAMVAIRYKRE